MSSTSEFLLFTTRRNAPLAEAVAQALGQPIQYLHSERFSDGEAFVRFDRSVRGQTVVLFWRVEMPYDNLFELLLAIDAARRSSAREVICVLPYLPHSRQERRDGERTSVAARLMADMIQQAGPDRIITLDLHTTAIEGFYRIPMDHLEATGLFVREIQALNLPDLCLCSPDFGGLKRIRTYRKHLVGDLAVIQKERLRPNQVESMEVIGDVNGKHVVIVDDIIDTAGTLCKAAELLQAQGAQSVRAFCTHGILSGEALARIEASPLAEVVITDSIGRNNPGGKIRTISIAPFLAQALQRLLHNQSIQELNNSLTLAAAGTGPLPGVAA